MKDLKKRIIAFGNYLGRMRAKRGYSIRQLSYITNVNGSYISMLENHRRETLPKISTINKLANGLKISPSIMYELAGVKGINSNKFGKTLRRIRKKRGLGDNQLSLLSGVSSSGISEIELGERGVPTLKVIKKLSKALKISPKTLLNAAGFNLGLDSIDLKQAINDSVKLTWDGQPLTRSDILAIKLWFNHRNV